MLSNYSHKICPITIIQQNALKQALKKNVILDESQPACLHGMEFSSLWDWIKSVLNSQGQQASVYTSYADIMTRTILNEWSNLDQICLTEPTKLTKANSFLN